MLIGYGLDVDDRGNTYFSGSTYQRFSFGNTNFDGGMILGKCDAKGNLLWMIREGRDSTAVSAFGLDGARNIYALVNLSYYDRTGVSLAGNMVTGKVALAKYDQDGHGLWAKAIVASGSSVDPIVCPLSVDRIGNSYWTFFFSGAATFGATNVTVSGYSGALLKCDPNGDVSWVRVIEVANYSQVSYPGVYIGTPGIDRFGNVYVCGHFEGGASFGSTNLAGARSLFLAKYNQDGDLLWVKPSSSGWSGRLVVDSAGNCFTQVGFKQSATFGSITLSNDLATNFLGVVKYDPSGDVLWAKQACQSSSLATVAGDPAGNFYLAAECDDRTTLYVKYDAEGNVAWSKPGQPSTVYGLRADALGQCYALGRLRSTNVMFDSFLLAGADPQTDAFIAKLDTTTRPSLNTSASNGFVTVSWPVLAEGFYLESKSEWATPTWTSNSASFQIVGALNQVTLPASGPSGFFRLRRE